MEQYNKELSCQTVRLEEVFLDPNNPRLATEGSKSYPLEATKNPKKQEQLLEEMCRFGVEELKNNIARAGFLKIDRIVLRPLSDGGYVVLEGNRRVAAMKLLHREHETGDVSLPEPVLKSIQEFEALVYTGADQEAAWMFQGLRHISGIRDWPPYQKAKLLVDQMESAGLGFGEVGEMFGVSTFQAGQWVRSFHAFRQMKDECEDYRARLTPSQFAYVMELFGKSNRALRDWLEWDEQRRKFRNSDRLEKFVSWIVPATTEEEAEDVKAIRTTTDVRTVNRWLTEAPDVFRQFEGGGASFSDCEASFARNQAEKEYSEGGLSDLIDEAGRFSRRLAGMPLIPAVEQRQRVINACKELIRVCRRVIRELGKAK